VKKNVPKYTPEQKEQLRKAIAALSAEAQLKSQVAADQRDTAIIAEGTTFIQKELGCTDCHQFHTTDPDATAPDLTTYGSRKWLIGFINNPAHPTYYGERNDRMPAFGTSEILDSKAIELVADWLRGDWYEPSAANRPE
jgi:mono/diheme cytochrome c family protein